uniref:Uncharacterized protein n=1 Tax=Odontella aurita TaxID=265563 RepID=A0A7S4N6E0_9STRA|mmetsp:Transcript_49283/g.148352  ORF Transcript_49283/g.148352 Transcript_49283/m.148352 type:complete len:383 (+) Transcript_49283:372-1520(+)
MLRKKSLALSGRAPGALRRTFWDASSGVPEEAQFPTFELEWLSYLISGASRPCAADRQHVGDPLASLIFTSSGYCYGLPKSESFRTFTPALLCRRGEKAYGCELGRRCHFTVYPFDRQSGANNFINLAATTCAWRRGDVILSRLVSPRDSLSSAEKTLLALESDMIQRLPIPIGPTRVVYDSIVGDASHLTKRSSHMKVRGPHDREKQSNDRFDLAIGGCLVFAFSDWLEGYIAWNYEGQVTVLGTYLDPFADKFIINILSASLWYVSLLPGPIVSLWLARDVGLVYTSYRFVANRTVAGRAVIDPSRTPLKVNPTLVSRVNTVLQFGTISAGMAQPLFGLPEDVVLGLCWVTAGTTVASALSYLGGESMVSSGNKRRKGPK